MRWIAQTVRRREPRESRAAVRPNEQTNRGKAISPPTSESFEGIGINAHVEIDTGAQGDARPASIVGDLYRTARTRSSSATYEFLEREREREREMRPTSPPTSQDSWALSFVRCCGRGLHAIVPSLRVTADLPRKAFLKRGTRPSACRNARVARSPNRKNADRAP